jgi:UvrD/REP helicase N-terminal domain/UvrD-like helicase C-terminal domain
MDYQPTGEQNEIQAAYDAGMDIAAMAYAGAGKTSTLKQLCKSSPRKRVLYLAYGKDIQLEAEKTFPRNVTCKTSHGLAFKPMIDLKHKLEIGRKSGQQMADIMHMRGPVRLTADRLITPGQVASIMMQTIKQFCFTADKVITDKHVPADLRGIDDPAEVAALRKIIPPLARKAWAIDISKPNGRLPYTHDHYLKLFALTHPRLDYDVIMMDEGQDANPCVYAMFLEQAKYGTQLIMVGDSYQAIFGWRMAKDELANFSREPGVVTLYLTQSFRFGAEIAAEGNKWLRFLGAPKPLIGNPAVRSRVGQVSGTGDVILCRTNAEAIKRAVAALDEGMRVCFPGGAGELLALTDAAKDLQETGCCQHQDLMGFGNWAQVQDFADTDEGSDLKRFVDMVDEHTAAGLAAILRKIVKDPAAADITISTAHKAKGLEWAMVELAEDFRAPKKGRDGSPARIRRDEAMLIYVAITRAKNVADLAAIAWAEEFLTDGPADDDTPTSAGPAHPASPVSSATMTITADPAMLAAIKTRIDKWFPGATVELGSEVVAAG